MSLPAQKSLPAEVTETKVTQLTRSQLPLPKGEAHTHRDQHVLAAMPAFTPALLSSWPGTPSSGVLLAPPRCCNISSQTLHALHGHTTEPQTKPGHPRSPRHKDADAVPLKFLSPPGKSTSGSCRNPAGSPQPCRACPLSQPRQEQEGCAGFNLRGAHGTHETDHQLLGMGDRLREKGKLFLFSDSFKLCLI